MKAASASVQLSCNGDATRLADINLVTSRRRDQTLPLLSHSPAGGRASYAPATRQTENQSEKSARVGDRLRGASEPPRCQAYVEIAAQLPPKLAKVAQFTVSAEFTNKQQ